MAPYGVDDLVNLIVRLTPVFGHKIDVYRERVTAKDWPARWPGLMAWEEAYSTSHRSFDRIDT